MYIKRYQVGGVVYTPFVPNQAQTTTGTSSEISSKSSSSDDGKLTGIKKEIVEILQSNGIPSDVEKFLSRANSFLSNSTSLSNMSLFGGTDDDYDLSDLVKIQKMANDVKWNKERHEKAVSNLDDEDAWGEVAMDSRGYMYVQDAEGNITTVSATEYAKGFEKGEYQAITNEQLLGLREKYSEFAMNSDILNSISGTIGIKSVQDYLVGIVEKLGTTTEQGYASKKQKQIINGIEALMAAGPDGYYKITNEHQAKDVETALTYLYSQLSEPMKRTLRTTIAANGGDPAKDQATFIGMILTQHTDHTQKADFDVSTTKHYLEQTGQDNSPEKMTQINDAIRLGTGQDLGVPQRLQIVTKEGGAAFSVFAQSAGKVKDSQGNPLGSTNLEQLLLKSEAVGGIALSGSISFGDQLLHESDYNKIMYNGNKNMYRVEMPCKEVSPGKFVPNLELHAKLNRVQDRLKGQPKIKQNILSALKAEGISEHEIYVDEQGNLTAKNTMPFLVLGGIAGSGTLDFNEESPYIHNLSREEGNSYKGVYNNVILSGDPYKDKNITGNSKTLAGYNMYEGNIFIAIDPSVAAHVGGKTMAPQSAVTNVTQQNMQHSGMITNF